MKVTFRIFIFLILFSGSCYATQDDIDMFIMDYPHGEYRIHVKKTGEAYLYYGSRASAKVIKKDTFSTKKLYSQFRLHLYPNLPREQWPNPKSQAGMVTIIYTDGKKKDYLIFDLYSFTNEIFDRAKDNIIGEFLTSH